MIHVVKISKVPRALGLAFQWTMLVPLPNKRALIFLKLIGSNHAQEAEDRSKYRPMSEGSVEELDCRVIWDTSRAEVDG